MVGLQSIDIESGVAVGLFIWWCFQWLLHFIAIVHGWMKLHRHVEPCSVYDDQPPPGVSVLKPLTGVEKNLLDNLETFFNMNYPMYELLFCVENDTDSAIAIVNSLMARYPKVNAQLFVGSTKIGVNPKINNMAQGYKSAKHSLILISDSGLRMREDTLSAMMSFLDKTTGLVHQMPFLCDQEGFSGVLEKVYFGTQHAKVYLSADLLGINCVTGMSCLFRKDVLEDAGGLPYLGKFLAEDYQLCKLFIDRRWKLKACSQPAWQNAGNSSVRSFQARMIRWIKLRSTLAPSIIIIEPMSESMLLGIMMSWSVSVLFDWSPFVFFFVHILTWFALDYVLLRVVQGGELPFSLLHMLAGWLFRESTSMLMMLKAHSQNEVTWRNRKYIVKLGGVGEDFQTGTYTNDENV